jgi:hypothetical protein
MPANIFTTLARGTGFAVLVAVLGVAWVNGRAFLGYEYDFAARDVGLLRFVDGKRAGSWVNPLLNVSVISS